jgi:hypothetical protein
MMAPKEVCGPEPPFGHFISSRNQRHDLPQCWKFQTAKETLIHVFFAPPYTNLRPGTHFTMAMCHDIAGHTRPYANTQGLLGLWSIDQNLITVLAWFKAAFVFSLKKFKNP